MVGQGWSFRPGGPPFHRGPAALDGGAEDADVRLEHRVVVEEDLDVAQLPVVEVPLLAEQRRGTGPSLGGLTAFLLQTQC